MRATTARVEVAGKEHPVGPPWRMADARRAEIGGYAWFPSARHLLEVVWFRPPALAYAHDHHIEHGFCGGRTSGQRAQLISKGDPGTLTSQPEHVLHVDELGDLDGDVCHRIFCSAQPASRVEQGG